MSKLTKEEIRNIEDFAKTNPDDFDYIMLLFQAQYDWADLLSGKRVYVGPPPSSAEEVEKAFKKIIERIKEIK